MIKYSLICDHEHEFDGWFPSIKEFEGQKKKGWIACPICGSLSVDRAIMAPAVKKTGKGTPAKIQKMKQDVQSDQMMMASQAKTVMRQIRKYIVKNFENVGKNFYEEAVKSSGGERDDKFYGTPSQEEVNKLLEEGVDLFHVPDNKDN